nr:MULTISPECIES: RRXRR domain-containing protein [unclassified Coleofasciculus]
MGHVTNALEISHRGQQIKGSLESRRALRRGRRSRKTRCRFAIAQFISWRQFPRR